VVPFRRLLLLIALAVGSATAVAACGEDDVQVPTGTTADAPDPGTPPDTGNDTEAGMERAIFDLVNDERRERGLEPFAWDDDLAGLAREWSRSMADDGNLEHQDSQAMLEAAEGLTAVGENIFRATGPVPASTIHVGWMRSDGHRANVLRPAFDRLGVGVHCAEDGAVWATQRFGRTSGGDRPDPTDDVPAEEPIVAEEGEGPSCPAGGGEIQVELDGIRSSSTEA
jgi:uncharacterized protein YkwD